MFRRILLFVIGIGLLTGCAAPTPEGPSAASTTPALQKIRLPMGYIPSVQYAPFYVAAENGYFAEAGVEVEFDYSFETNGVQLVGAGELPLAVVSGEQVLLARAHGLPVTYVMAWFQKSPVAVIAKASAGIAQPADLKGKTIGTPTLDGANYVGLQALLAAAQIKPEDVTVQAIGFNQVPLLVADQVAAVVVYANNEPIRLAAQGEQLSVIPVGDYVPLAANGLLTNEDTIANNPELVRAFVRALARGIEFTIANPDEAYTISKKYAEFTDAALEKQVLAATIEMWKTDRIGFSQPEAWQTMQDTLLATGLLSQPQDLGKVYSNAFVP